MVPTESASSALISERAVGAGRLVRLRAWMATEAVDAAYITRPISIAYLTGFHAEPIERLMALIVHAGGATLVVPALERESAVNSVIDVGVVAWRDGEDPYALVSDALRAVRRVAVEKEHLTVKAAESLQAVVGSHELVDATEVIRRMRRTKNAAELEKLRRAAAITDHATADILPRLRVGQSELEVATILAATISAAGGTPAFETLVQFGPSSAQPHHTPSARTLQAGELVLLDFGAAYEGYRADTTRMAVAGEPTSLQREIHRVVLKAHDVAIDAVRAGVTAGSVDAAARGVIDAQNFGDRFIHRTGHGLGLEAHEDPSLEPGSTLVLEAGMVATIEPGIYIEGWGGVRIEDDVVVEAGGCRLLTQADRSLHVIP
jgi:Xaa-Pro dipeptidase